MIKKGSIVLFSILVILFSSFVIAQDENVDVDPVDPEPESQPDPVAEPEPEQEKIDEPTPIDEPEPKPDDDYNEGLDCAVLYCQPGYDCVNGVGCIPPEDDGGDDNGGDYCPTVEGFRIVGGTCVPTQDGCLVEFGNIDSCQEHVDDNIHVPQGCYIVETETGISEYECGDDEEYWKDVERQHQEMKKKCNSQGLLFDVVDGQPQCILEGKGGFGGVECPRGKVVEDFKRNCKGEVDFYLDQNGCNAMTCIEREFGDDYDMRFRERYGDDSVKFDAFECKSKGGKFVRLGDENRCLERESGEYRHTGFKQENLDAIDLLKIAIKIETVTISLESVREKLDGISEFYESRDEEKARVYSNGAAKMEGAISRLEEIRFGLAENADSLGEDDRIRVLKDLQITKGLIKDIALEILTGKRISREDVERDKFGFDEDFDDFQEGPHEGIDILTGIANCDQDSPEDPFVFSPEHGMTVRLEGLDDQGRCIMKPQPDDAPFDVPIDIRLPTEVYKYFTGPEMLLRDDVECKGIGCQFMLKDIEREIEFENEFGGPRRFGEDEFERHGPEGREFFDDERGPRDPIGDCMGGCIGEVCPKFESSCVEGRAPKCTQICEERIDFDDFRFEDERRFEGGGDSERCMVDCMVDLGLVPGQDCGPNVRGEEPPECFMCVEKCGFYGGPDDRDYDDEFKGEFREEFRDDGYREEFRFEDDEFKYREEFREDFDDGPNIYPEEDFRDDEFKDGPNIYPEEDFRDEPFFEEPKEFFDEFGEGDFFEESEDFTIGNVIRRFADRLRGE